MKSYVSICLILVIAAGLRLCGINWDEGYQLHPDERFLIQVLSKFRLPAGLASYLDPHESPLNPYNVGYSFYIYGTLPLTLNKLIAVALGTSQPEQLQIIGRALSTLCDIGTLILVICLARLFEQTQGLSPRVKYFAGLLYALSVASIQHSHFFVVDTFLIFFITAALYFSLRYHHFGFFGNLLMAAVFFGAALGSKISAVYLFPVIITLITFGCKREAKQPLFPDLKISRILLFGLISYLTWRFADPKSFLHANLLDPRLSPKFLSSIASLKALSDPNILYPPGIQWIDTIPIILPLQNILFFGLGIPHSFFLMLGIFQAIRTKNTCFLVMGLLVLVFVVWQGMQFAKPIRYFLPAYPYFCLLAALGLEGVLKILVQKKARVFLSAAVLFTALIWPLCFVSIYLRTHSRIEASQWIYENIPAGSVLAVEHWDDPLPLRLKGYSKSYDRNVLTVFDSDTLTKWKAMDPILKRSEYIILSSNRGYGSIMQASKLYPHMSKFYKRLFLGLENFEKVKEFTSYPSFFGLFEIPDQWAEESFTVYDHPKVMIFKRQFER